LPVVYFGHNIPAVKKEVPLILSGSSPDKATLHTQIGSNDFNTPPYAVVTGGGYDDAAFDGLYDACAEACGSPAKLPVPFLRTSNEITARLAAEGKGPVDHVSPDYASAVVERLKEKLKAIGIAPGLEIDRSKNRGERFLF
jgi:hypothetical protein